MHDIDHWRAKVGICADEHLRSLEAEPRFKAGGESRLVELLILDEAERLTPTALELLRDPPALGPPIKWVRVAVLVLVPTSGWVADAPLSDTAFMSGFVFLDPTHRWAVAVGIAGLVLASWATGFLAGRRTT
jgi:hypothetical protein